MSIVFENFLHYYSTCPRCSSQWNCSYVGRQIPGLNGEFLFCSNDCGVFVHNLLGDYCVGYFVNLHPKTVDDVIRYYSILNQTSQLSYPESIPMIVCWVFGRVLQPRYLYFNCYDKRSSYSIDVHIPLDTPDERLLNLPKTMVLR